jgi:hypothetical protein
MRDARCTLIAAAASVVARAWRAARTLDRQLVVDAARSVLLPLHVI